MTVEELVAKLSFKVSGVGDVKKFIKALEDARKAAEKLGKSNKFNFSGSSSGLGRIIKDFERAARSARNYRMEIEKAARVRMRGPGAFPMPGRVPGRVPGGGGGRPPGGGRGPGGRTAAAAASGGDGIGGLVSGAATVATGAVALKKYGSLEQAVTELGITAGKTAKEMAADVHTFEVEGPKLGVTAQSLVEATQAFAAAGIDYDTAVKSSLITTKASKASFTKMDDAASAGIVTIQNLGVKIGDLGKAYDIMIAGGKLGKAEFKELASTMPQLASSGAKAGMKGTEGLRDLVSALEVVRESAPTTADAAIHLKDFIEKMSDPVTQKYFKKYAKVDIEKEMKDADSKGQSRLDRMLDVTGKYTKGDSFRLAELFHEQQSRDAIQQLITKRGKFNEYRDTIDKTAAGTTDTDLARVMELFNTSVDKFTSAVDRFLTTLGGAAAPAAKGALDVGSAALEGLYTGEGSKGGNDAIASKMNRLFGAPPTYHGVLGDYGASITKGSFEDRFGKGPMSKGGARSMMPGSVNPTPGAIGRNSFGLGGGIGSGANNLNMMKQGANETTTNNTTNNTDVGNDKRTQSVAVTVNATGLAEVAALVKSNVQSGLSSMGPSIVKANSIPTAGGTASSPSP